MVQPSGPSLAVSFGGGKGAAIGAGAGGGGGAALNGFTPRPTGQHPVRNCRALSALTNSITVRTYDQTGGADDDYRNNGLQQRPTY